MEGKLFAPLAYTIAIALAISLLLSLTLSPVLSSYLLKGGSEEDTWLVRVLRRPYDYLLHWAHEPSKDYGLRGDRDLLRRAVSLSFSRHILHSGDAGGYALAQRGSRAQYLT